MEGAVELARQHWAEGDRGVRRAKASEPRLHARLLQQIDVVTEVLRRRVGRTFTLAELAAAYARADSWAYDALEDHAEQPDWVTSASTAVDAAFHLYARGARDYRP